MESNTKITVVITAYNLENFIGKCLKELKEQTFQDFDILIVDDCSTDGTLKVIEGMKEAFNERIEILALKNNLGLPALARNVALDSGLIKGEYVVFLDGDDSISERFLESLYNLANENQTDVAICAFDRVDSRTGEVFSVEMTGFGRKVMDDIFQDDLVAFINTSPWNKLWKREAIEGLRYPAFKVGEEVTFNFRGYLNSRRIAFTDEILIHYRIRRESVISNTDKETIWQFEHELRILYNEIQGNAKDVAGLVVFFHIGLSMALRAADNKEINLKEHIKATRQIFRENYLWFRGNKFLKFHSLIHHGFKGVAIWCAFLSYKINLFGVAMRIYRALGLNIKF